MLEHNLNMTGKKRIKRRQQLTSSLIVSPSDEIRTKYLCEKKEIVIEQNTETYARLCDPPLPGYRCLLVSHGRKLEIRGEKSMDDV